MSRKKSAQPAKKESASKRAPGRPTLYDPAMCETVRALGTEGKSPAQIARALGVGFSTVQAWGEKHKEFGAALDNAYHLARAYWEDVGAAGVNMGMRFNSSAFIFLVKNRFPKEYRDRQEHQIQDNSLRSMISTSAEALDQRLNALVARIGTAGTDTEAVRTFEEFRREISEKHQVPRKH